MNIRSTGGCSFCLGGVRGGNETAVTKKSTMQSLHSLLVVDIRSTWCCFFCTTCGSGGFRGVSEGDETTTVLSQRWLVCIQSTESSLTTHMLLLLLLAWWFRRGRAGCSGKSMIIDLYTIAWDLTYHPHAAASSSWVRACWLWWWVNDYWSVYNRLGLDLPSTCCCFFHLSGDCGGDGLAVPNE